MKLAILLLLAATGNALGQSLCTGIVIDRTLKTPVKGATVYLRLEDYAHGETFQNYTIHMQDSLGIDPALITIDSMVTDSSGRFTFIVQDTSSYSLECFLLIDSNYSHWDIERRLRFDDHVRKEITLMLPVYCEYTQYQNQDSCPVCTLKDKCIEVMYGLPVPDFDAPDELIDPAKKKIYWAGCVVDRRCYARWYCKRCKKLF